MYAAWQRNFFLNGRLIGLFSFTQASFRITPAEWYTGKFVKQELDFVSKSRPSEEKQKLTWNEKMFNGTVSKELAVTGLRLGEVYSPIVKAVFEVCTIHSDTVHCKYIRGNFYSFNCVRISTVISLYGLHFIAAPSTV